MAQQSNKLWIDADWPAPKNVRAGTSLRIGGHSKTPYNSLNLAQHVGDDPDDVRRNRNILSHHFKFQSEPFWLNQTHSSNIISIDNTLVDREADGSFTSCKNKVCTIMTADCVPVLLCNKSGTGIAAIHAGWKGICSGIIENAIKSFSEPEEILVWIGPCISSEHYEVGKDVYESCLNHSNLVKSAFKPNNVDHWYANLVKIVSILLENKGVGSIYECNLCTYEMDDLFFSYRRDGNTGRTASMIWME
jgi:hypothetical protein